MRPMNRVLKHPRTVATVIAITFIFLVLFSLLIIEEYLLSIPNFETNSEKDLSSYKTDTEISVQLYNQWSINENRRVFEWHARSTKVLFWVSIFITVTGISFAFWQFVEASQKDEKATKADSLELKTALISLGFKSRSLATFMMFISIAYLLIYVTLVYPIQIVRSGEGITGNTPVIAEKLPQKELLAEPVENPQAEEQIKPQENNQ